MSEAVDAKTKDNEEETIPILQLTAVSKKGTIPCKVSGSLRIPVRDMPELKPVHTEKVGSSFNIVDGKEFPTAPKWKVLVNFNNDDLTEATVVKGKVCQKYIRINAQLSFEKLPAYVINDYIVKDNNKDLREKIEKAIKDSLPDEIQLYLGLNYIRKVFLSSEDVNPGEWLLPIKIKVNINGDEADKLLAYVRVNIKDEADKPASS